MHEGSQPVGWESQLECWLDNLTFKESQKKPAEYDLDELESMLT
jgi:hypothetical protein